MKTHFNLIALFSFAFFATSCSRYQYVTIESFKPSQSKGIVSENDTVKVTYSFKGKNCPVRLEVFNKLNTPIVIDWTKSALIMNDQRYGYWEDKTKINATTRGEEIEWFNGISLSESNTTGTLSKEEQTSFIPPNSFISVNPITAKNLFFKVHGATPNQKIAVSRLNSGAKGEKYSYTKENSPMKFRSFLTFSTTQNGASPFYFDDEFWVSEIVSTYVAPSNLIDQDKPTQFFLSEGTGVGTVMAIVITVPIIVVATSSKTNSQ
jgi:hypothetical protein